MSRGIAHSRPVDADETHLPHQRRLACLRRNLATGTGRAVKPKHWSPVGDAELSVSETAATGEKYAAFEAGGTRLAHAPTFALLSLAHKPARAAVGARVSVGVGGGARVRGGAGRIGQPFSALFIVFGARSSGTDYEERLNAGSTVSANSRAGSRVSRPKNSITNIVQPAAMCAWILSMHSCGVPAMP